MLTPLLVIQIFSLFVTPVAVGVWFNRRLGLGWSLLFGGTLAFVAAWVIANFVALPGELGLALLSIAQIGALYLVYRFQLRVSSEREALMVGVGLAGIELLLFGILATLSLAQMLPLRDATDETIIELAARIDDVSEEEVSLTRVYELQEDIDDYWSTSWYVPLLQLTQSLAILPIQMALAVIVIGALADNSLRPLLYASVLHFLSRLLPIYGGIFGGVVVWFGLSLICGGIALAFLKKLQIDVQGQTADLVAS